MAQIRADEIARVLREEIEGFDQAIQVAETGYVAATGDGIAHIQGLDKAMAGELLSFPYGISGIALNLDEDEVGAVILGEADEIKEGDEVRRTGRIMSVPVGPKPDRPRGERAGPAARRQGADRQRATRCRSSGSRRA